MQWHFGLWACACTQTQRSRWVSCLLPSFTRRLCYRLRVTHSLTSPSRNIPTTCKGRSFAVEILLIETRLSLPGWQAHLSSAFPSSFSASLPGFRKKPRKAGMEPHPKCAAGASPALLTEVTAFPVRPCLSASVTRMAKQAPPSAPPVYK